MPRETPTILGALLILAAGVVLSKAIVQFWLMSKLFAAARARIESWRNPVSTLMGCQFCLSNWITFGFSIVTFLICPWDWWFGIFFWWTMAYGVQVFYKLFRDEY